LVAVAATLAVAAAPLVTAEVALLAFVGASDALAPQQQQQLRQKPPPRQQQQMSFSLTAAIPCEAARISSRVAVVAKKRAVAKIDSCSVAPL
jgi:hypothetical protein